MGISVVEPHYYAKRFLRMLERILDAPASANSNLERAAESGDQPHFTACES